MSKISTKRIGGTEFKEIIGRSYKRKVGTTEWIELEKSPSTGPSLLELKLVLEMQSPGEPDHWSLFLSREGAAGTVFQATGDAIAMTYSPVEDTNLLDSPTYKTSYIIAQLDNEQAARVRFRAVNEPPPSAPNQADVRENCQGWAIRVIGRLVGEGIVEEKWVGFARGMQQPVC